MRRTLIAVLLVLAMLFVSCSPESRKSEETTKPAEPAATSPTAQDFLSAYLSGLYSYNIVNELWKETKAEGETALSVDKVNTKEFRKNLLLHRVGISGFSNSLYLKQKAYFQLCC